MDRFQKALAINSVVNQFDLNEISSTDFILEVCKYFDFIKNHDLSEADKKFLIYLSNKVGLPHYYDMLSNFNNVNNTKINNIDLITFSSLLYESTLFTDSNLKLHKYQKEVLNKFSKERQNRYFLSASTSFGKTFLVYEIIKKMEYNNIILIFPTIALLTENLERLKEDSNYKYFNDYTIHTLSDFPEDEINEKNILIYTPERFLSFLDKNANRINFDFIFVDEVYKIDNEYLIEEEAKVNERDLAYRMAISFALSIYGKIDMLLAGPYINFLNDRDNNYNPSFDLFLKKNNIKLIDKNNCEIVNKSIYPIPLPSDQSVDSFSFDFKGANTKRKKLKIIIKEILNQKENMIVYCSDRSSAESNSLDMINDGVNVNYDYSNYSTFIKHLENLYDPNWIITKSLKSGFGVHHGLVPKYIQKEIIKLFNNGFLRVLFSTTTITEGVNTSAKNIIIYFYKKGRKILLPFDAKNITGRAGRFLQHYSGRVFYLNKEFNEILESTSEGIKHKNYDEKSPKSDLDVEITDSEYLTSEEKEKKERVKQIQKEKKIPEEIMQQFKVVSREDKIYFYDQIRKLSDSDHKSIKTLITKINYNLKIDFDGFQVILNLLLPKISDKKLKEMIEFKVKSKSEYRSELFDEYSILVFNMHYYLSEGFLSLYNWTLKYKFKKFSKEQKANKNEQCVNGAMRDTSNLIYNIFKYQLVKYLGVFNIMYKFDKSQRLEKSFEEVSGIEKLLSKLEYNAFGMEARLASDYGVTNNIIEYYDTKAKNREKIKFDDFEKDLLKKVEKIIHKD